MAAMSKVEEGAWRIRSALLVDVDNMFLGLQAISPAAAAVFVADPDRWMRWLTDLSYPRVGGDAERDILVRACSIRASVGPGARRSCKRGFRLSTARH